MGKYTETEEQKQRREEGFNKLKARQEELFKTKGIRAFIDGVRLVAKNPETGKFEEIK